MARTIDNRVVEMDFDNSNFEKNVSKSLTTLDKLKKALNLDGAAKGFDEVDTASKKLNFDKLISAAETLEKRFSLFGEIGAVAIQRVANSVMDLTNKTIGFVTNGIINGGINRAMNLENANFQLQGLLKSEEKVAAVMEDVSWSVDGTAYGLDAAAKAASMFAATGMQAGDEMKTALRGVAGVAAMTNSEYENISQIFTTVAGNGRLMGDQLLQLSTRGLNAAATLADYLTKVGDGAKVTEAEVRDMVSKGQISFATFAAAMDDAFGEHAKNANKTFNGAMSNIRAALARIGADFVSPLIVQEGPLVNMLNAIRVKINEVRAATTPFAEEVTSHLNVLLTLTTQWIEALDLRQTIVNVQRVWGGFVNMFTAFGKVAKSVGNAFKDIFPESAESILTKLSIGFNKLTYNMIPSEETCNNITRAFRGFFSIVRDAGEAAMTVASGALSLLEKALGKVNINITEIPAKFGDFVIKLKDMTDGVNIFLAPFNALSEAFTKGKDVVKNWISEFKQLPQVRSALESLNKTIGPVKESIINFGKDCANAIGSFIGETQGLKGVSFDNLKELGQNLRDIFVGAFESLKGYILDFPTFLKNVKNAIAENLTGITNLFSSFWDGIKKIFGALRDFFSNGNTIAGIISLAFGTGLFVLIRNIMQTVMPFFNSLPKLVGSITGVFNQLKKSIKQLTTGIMFEKVADSIYTIAKSITLLAAALVVLSQIDPEKLQNGGTALLLISIGLAALVAAFSKLDSVGKVDFKGIGLSFIAMGAAIMLLTNSITKLAKLSVGELAKGFTVITLLVGEMVGVAMLLNKNVHIIGKDSKATNSALSMVSFAMSINTLVKALKNIADMPLADVVGGLGVMTALILEMIATMKLTSNSGWEQGVTFLAMAVSIQLMINAIKKLGETDPEIFIKGEMALTSMMGIISVMMLISALASRLEGDSGSKGGAGLVMLEMAAAMLLVGYSIEKIGSLDIATILKGEIAVTAIMAVFAAIIAVTKLAGDNAAKVGITLLAMSASIMILSGAIAILGSLDTKAVAQGTAAVSALMAMFALVIASTKFANDSKATLIIITVAVGMLAAAIAVLAAIEPDRLLPASAALSAVLAMFALVIASTGLAGDAKVTILLMAAVVAELAAIFVMLQDLNPENLLGTSAALSLLLVSLSAAFLILSNAKDVSMGSIAALAAMGLVVAELAVILGLMQALNVTPNIETVASLSLLLAAMAGILVLLSTMHADVATATNAALALSSFVGILGGVMTALGALYTYVPQLEEFLDKGIDILVQIGEGLGRFAGAIIEGFLDQIIGGLPGMADNLSLFMQKLDPFLEGAKSITPGSLDGVGALAGAIISLSGAQIVDAIKNFLPWVGSMDDFAGTLVAFGKAMAGYSAEVSGKIDPEAVTASATAGETLVRLQNMLPRKGGTFQEWFGEKSTLDQFAVAIILFGTAMVNYSKAITAGEGIKTQAVEDSARAAQALADLQNSLPSTGGKLQEWLGETMSLQTFGDNLALFGTKMVEYSDAITAENGIDVDAIEDSARAAQLLADLQNSLPTVGGKLQDWFGGQMTLAAFGENLQLFGHNLVDYSDTITSGAGVNKDAIEDSYSAAKMMSDLQNTLPKESGTLQKFFGGGQMDLATFGENLVSFGNSISQYSAILALGKGIDLALIETSVDATKMLVNMAENLGEKKSWFSSEKTMSDFGGEIVTFGSQFAKGAGYLTSVNTFTLTMAIGCIHELIQLAREMAAVETSGMKAFGESLKNLANFGIEEFANTFANSYSRINGVIESFVSAAAQAVTKNQSLLTVAILNMVSETINTLDRTTPDFTSSGYKLMEGFITGLSQQKVSTGNMAKEIINYVLTQIKNQQKEFKSAAELLMTNFIAELQNKKETTNSKVKEILNLCLNSMRDFKDEFKTVGEDLMTMFIKGLEDRKSPANNQVEIIVEDMLKTIRGYQSEFQSAAEHIMTGFNNGFSKMANSFHTQASNMIGTVYRVMYAYGDTNREFYNTGVHYVNGLVNGMDDRRWYAEYYARQLAAAVDTAVRNKLKINSPSKLAYETGGYYGEGFVNAITAFVAKAYNAAADMAGGANNGLNDAIDKVVSEIDDRFDLTPVITPRIDAANAIATAEQINALFNGGRSYGLTSEIRDNRATQNQNGFETAPETTSGASYQFVQNNYSPKALSRIEIYRQTKNQFAAFKEATVST